MNRSHRSLILVATIFIATCAVFVLSYSKDAPLEKEIVSIHPVSPLQYTIPVGIQASVYEAMTTFASSSKTFNFKGEYYPELGFFIEEINGKKIKNGFYWTLYVNGLYSNKGASSHVVYPGDSINWKYEKL